MIPDMTNMNRALGRIDEILQRCVQIGRAHV